MVDGIEIRIRLMKVGIALVKVTRGERCQLIVGGHLVLERVSGETHRHPELPEYTPDMFPCDFSEWEASQADSRYEDLNVKVEICRNGRFSSLGAPRAAAYLFSAKPKDEVVAWCQNEAS